MKIEKWVLNNKTWVKDINDIEYFLDQGIKLTLKPKENYVPVTIMYGSEVLLISKRKDIVFGGDQWPKGPVYNSYLVPNTVIYIKKKHLSRKSIYKILHQPIKPMI